MRFAWPLSVASLMLAALAGCNALTGVDDLVVDDSSSGAGGGHGTSGAGGATGQGVGGATVGVGPASSSEGTGAVTTGAGASTGTSGTTSTSTSATTSTSASATTSTSTSATASTSTSSTGVGSTSSSSSSSTTSSGATSPAEVCLNTINMYRATRGLPAYTRWTSAESCVAQEATTDEGKNSAHWSFINQGMCGSNAEDECPGYSVNPLNATDGITTCLALMWAEKDQSICSGCDTCDFPYDNCKNCVFSGSNGECGHYLNMKSSVLSTVACGFSTVGWYAQDFK